MFSSDMKYMIAEKVQKILQETLHPELPKGEINFLLHVDGAEDWSWANIRNNKSARSNLKIEVIDELNRNITIKPKVSIKIIL